MKNAFYFGDNLHILREYVPDESVDLIYLDPPFNSNANYNLLFRSPDKSKWSDAQIATFEDTWTWGEAAEETFEYLEMTTGNVGAVVGSLRRILGENDMLAYLTMMAARLVELRRVLKGTGSFYLHCDSTASHYLKVLLDAVFGPQFFKNEIVWKRTTTHNDSKTWSRNSDTILFYTASSDFTWETPREKYSDEYIASKYRHDDGDGRLYQLDNMTSPSPRPNMMYEWRGFPYPAKGWRYSLETMQKLDREDRIWYPTKPDGQLDVTRRPRLKRYLDEMPGPVMGNIWTDINPLNSQAQERLGYPTQKPLALLERIIAASSKEGDVVLDPFCGCGTSLHAAHQMNRRWLGIDVAVQAMRVVQDRLINEFPSIDFEVFGIPQSADSARYLAEKHPFKFEEWAVAAVGAMHSGKFRGDGGIDGSFFWLAEKDEKSRGIVSVKGGKSLNPGMIRDLIGTLERERRETSDPSAIGIFLSAHKPSKGMIEEARKAGYVETFIGRIPAIQILTVDDIFEGKTIKVPALYDTISAAAAGRSGSRRSIQFKDPQEILRQRSMFFSFKGGASGGKEESVMPKQVSRVA